MDWGTKRAINNVLLVAVAGVGLYFLYQYLSRGSGAGEASGVDEDCHTERAEMVSTCKSQCDETSSSSQLRAHQERQLPEDCMKACYQSRFGRGPPDCASRRVE
jgi:hypothetical protein